MGNFQFPSDQAHLRASQLDLTQDTRVKGWDSHFPSPRRKRLRSSCAAGSPVGGSPERRDWEGTPGVLLILPWKLLRLMREGCWDLRVTSVYYAHSGR